MTKIPLLPEIAVPVIRTFANLNFFEVAPVKFKNELVVVPRLIIEFPALPLVAPVGIVPFPIIDSLVTFVYFASFMLTTNVPVSFMLHEGRLTVTSPTFEVVISLRQALISVVVQAPAVTVLPDHVPHAAHEMQGKRINSIEINSLMNIGYTLR
jgi:hypothetical protein